jgi:hypothetical protein
MATRQDAKSLDLVSYALVFLIVVVVAEAIVAALIKLTLRGIPYSLPVPLRRK